MSLPLGGTKGFSGAKGTRSTDGFLNFNLFGSFVQEKIVQEVSGDAFDDARVRGRVSL
jgi:hypothetical protein